MKKHFWWFSSNFGFEVFFEVTGVNLRTLTSLAPSTHREFSISILKLSVKMAPVSVLELTPVNIFHEVLDDCMVSYESKTFSGGRK